MELKTFNEILNDLCDNFDSLISPRKISRTNTNIIFLIFKAVAKGLEVINNVCVTLSNKFNPISCSDEDLISVAKLVGTQRFSGSATGLYITITNKGSQQATLLAGFYHYDLDENTTFTFEILSDKVMIRGAKESIFAFSDNIGIYPVTAQDKIQVYSDVAIPSGMEFSCSDNKNLLGAQEESILDFRQRINTDTTRQNSIIELQTKLRNLPYLFDARVYFNNTDNVITYDGVTIPPYYLAIFYSGEARSEIARVVAQMSFFPTASSDTSVTVPYYNEAFVSGHYDVNIIPFKKTPYIVTVTYKADSVYSDTESIEDIIKTKLLLRMNGQIHKDVINEADIYNAITDLNVAGASILNIDLYAEGSAVPYLEVPLSRIPELTDVTFNQVA